MRAAESSFSGLEKTAKQVDAKGVFFDRGAHLQESEIAEWLAGHEEDDFAFGEFAATRHFRGHAADKKSKVR